MAENPYDVLGVGRSATQDEIKRAYRKLAHQHHPDKSSGDEQKFKEINAAYQILGNEQKRKQYDQFGESFAGGQGPGGGGMRWEDFAQQAGGQNPFGGEGFDIGDIFGDFFGGGRQQQRRRQAGQSLEMDMQLAFEDAVFGVEKKIEISKDATCPHCKGEKAEPGSKVMTCKTCNGSGSVQRVQRTILGAIRTSQICPTCGGEGKEREKNCKECGGRGVTKQKQKITVSVPAGIDDGQLLRVPGHGAMGESGVAGDLFITVHVEPHPHILREGNDLFSELVVSFPDAALGVTATVETIDGKKDIKIPSGVQNGQRLRMKGHGIGEKGGNRGDHYVIIRVETPQKLSRKEKKLYEDLRDNS
ncbi:MAG: molecular chaperone DnaJ [Patescibacteria group bacterium]|jgi:molecular chaperone DnaJ